MKEMNPFSFGDVFSPYQQKQPCTSSSEVFLYGNGSPPNREPCQTICTLQSWNADAAVQQLRGRSLDWAYGFNAHQLTSSFQKLQVSAYNQLQEVDVSSLSFNPYAEYNRYLGQPLATYHQSREHTPVSTKTYESDSLESEQPTDLSIQKNTLQNLDGERTADENSSENTDVSLRTYYGRSKSPNHGLTYTHLSDVSNDSEEDFDENRNIPKKINRGFAKKRFEKLRPCQLALPWISTHPVIERPNISMFDPVANYAQMVTGPPLQPKGSPYISLFIFNDKPYKSSHAIPKQKLKIVELEEDSFYEENDATRNAGNVAGGHVQPDAEENEVIDLTQDDDDDEGGMGSEQLHVQPPPSNQQILATSDSLEQTIQESTLSLQGPITPASTHTLPPTSSYLESSTVSVGSIMSPEKDSTAHHFLSQPSSSQNTSAHQNYFLPSPMLEDHSNSPRDKCTGQHLTDASPKSSLPDTTTTQKHKKRPYRGPKALCEAADCSGPKQLRRSPRLTKEVTRAYPKRNMRSQNHQVHCKPKPANQKARCAAPSQPRRSSRLQRAAIKRTTTTTTTKKRNRDPWNHKGLWRFVAQNAFKLPRHVWIQQKDGEPRRSRRLAKKMQRKKYSLRPRLHTKS